MATASTKAPLTKTVVARVPYLNCAPFFRGLAMDEAWELVDIAPRQLGLEAEQGRIVAGPMSWVDYVQLQDRFERLGALGIAVRGRCGSALLFSRIPVRQLAEGMVIAVSDETSTTALLLRLILEQRYNLRGLTYQRGTSQDAEAVLLIGDEALRFRAANRRYPFEIDLAFEWWLWQHLPMTFAVWAIRKDCAPLDKQALSRALQGNLARNMSRLEALASERAQPLGLPAAELTSYLENFIYRLSKPEEQGMKQFTQLVHDHRLL